MQRAHPFREPQWDIDAFEVTTIDAYRAAWLILDCGGKWNAPKAERPNTRTQGHSCCECGRGGGLLGAKGIGRSSCPPDAQASLDLESLALSALEDPHSSPEGKVVLAARFTKLEDKYKEAFCTHCHEKNFLIDVNCKYCGGELDAEMRTGNSLGRDHRHQTEGGWWNPWMMLGAAMFITGAALLLTVHTSREFFHVCFGCMIVGLVMFKFAGGEIGNAD